MVANLLALHMPMESQSITHAGWVKRGATQHQKRRTSITSTRQKRPVPTEPEKQILILLAKEWDLAGPPGIMDLSDMVRALPMAPGECLEAVGSLFAQGLVDMNKMKSSAFLTPEGYEAAKRV